MISKYDGICFWCKDQTHAGVDQYDVKNKVSYHQSCFQTIESAYESATKDEAEALADKLGFK